MILIFQQTHEWNGNAWLLKGDDIDGEAAGDLSGGAVGLSADGNTVAIGAIQNGSGKGHVSVYSGLCTTSSSTDVITACGYYTWIDNNTYTATTNSATYILTGANGCDSILTLDLTITTTIDSTISYDPPTISSNHEGGTYQWVDCRNGNFTIIPGATQRHYSVPTTGGYAVIVTDNNCASTPIDTSQCLFVNYSGIISDKNNADISLFPNPTKGMLHINLGEINEAVISIKNTLGQTVFSSTIAERFTGITIPGEDGLYFVEILYDEEIVTTLKVVKQ